MGSVSSHSDFTSLEQGLELTFSKKSLICSLSQKQPVLLIDTKCGGWENISFFRFSVISLVTELYSFSLLKFLLQKILHIHKGGESKEYACTHRSDSTIVNSWPIDVVVTFYTPASTMCKCSGGSASLPTFGIASL